MRKNRFDVEGEAFQGWNMNVAFLQRLDRRFEEVDQAFFQGDLIMAFRALDGIWSNIIHKVDEKGNKDQEEKVNSELVTIEGLILNKAANKNPLILEQKLRQLRREINRLLFTYGLVGNTKKQRVSLEEKLKRDYEGDFANEE